MIQILIFLVLSIALLFNGQATALAKNPSITLQHNDDMNLFQNDNTNMQQIAQVDSLTPKTSSQTNLINDKDADNSTNEDSKPHILKAGDYDAAYNAYITGYYKKAFIEAKKRADIGDPAAMTLVAKLYMEGRAVEQNSKTARDWFKKAADLGDPHAALSYGINLFNGVTVEKDTVMGADYIKRSAEAGVPDAYSFYGQILMTTAPEKDRLDIALAWFLKGAIAGDPYSIYLAADLLAKGTNKTKADEYAARALLESAANSGNIAAQLELATWTYDGRGGPKNDKDAFTLIKLVAVNNIPVAQVGLARFYFNGIGTNKDPIMGASWYLLAQQANQGAHDLDTLMKALSPEQLKEAQTRTSSLLYNP